MRVILENYLLKHKPMKKSSLTKTTEARKFMTLEKIYDIIFYICLRGIFLKCSKTSCFLYAKCS